MVKKLIIRTPERGDMNSSMQSIGEDTPYGNTYPSTPGSIDYQDSEPYTPGSPGTPSRFNYTTGSMEYETDDDLMSSAMGSDDEHELDSDEEEEYVNMCYV